MRRRLGLAPDRPVVLLMSLKMAVSEPCRRYVWGGAPGSTDGRRRRDRAARARVRDWKGNGYRSWSRRRRFLPPERRDLVVKSRRRIAIHAFFAGAPTVRGGGRGRSIRTPRSSSMASRTSASISRAGPPSKRQVAGCPPQRPGPAVPSGGVLRAQGDLRQPRGQPPAVAGGRLGIGHEEAAGPAGRRTLADFEIDPEARRRYLERSWIRRRRGQPAGLDVIERRS